MIRKRTVKCVGGCNRPVRVRTSALGDWMCGECSGTGYPKQVKLWTKEEVVESMRELYAKMVMRMYP